MAYSNRDETLHFADKMEGELLAAGEDAISREGKRGMLTCLAVVRAATTAWKSLATLA